MLARVSADVCVRCKGYKKLCGLRICPILERFRSNIRASLNVKGREVAGATPPSIIIGESGYPAVPVILNIPPNVSGSEAREYDDPLGWWGRVELDEIIKRRSYMVATIIKSKVSDVLKLYDKEISTAAASVKPVDGEALLKRPPKPRLLFKPGLDPVGPAAEASNIRIVGNPVIPKQLDSIIWDDVPASEAITELYFKGVDIYTIIRSLSLGLLGRLRNRKLVPTRWAITAVDRTIASYLTRRLRYFKDIGNIELYSGEYLGNKFIIILYPGRLTIEWVELWHPMTVFTGATLKPVLVYNKSDPMGRTLSIDGGFDAARLALIEALARRGRRASAIIFREVTPRYYASVGNWHIRETVRMALKGRPETFSSLSEALNNALKSLRVDDRGRSGVKSLIRSLRCRRLDEFAKQ